MVVYVGTAFNNSQVLLNVGQTVQSAIDSTGAQAPYYFLSVSKQANGGK
jgi:hypothetical protein